MSETLPTYDELPFIAGNPPRTSWGLWGDDDQFGHDQPADAGAGRRGAKLVRKGRSLRSTGIWKSPPRPSSSARRSGIRSLIPVAMATTTSTRTGTRNRQHSGTGSATSATRSMAFTMASAPTRSITLRLAQWHRALGTARIAGRGVLVDFARWAKANGVDANPATSFAISPAQFREAARAQGVTFQTGDILLFRTGWTEWYDS